MRRKKLALIIGVLVFSTCLLGVCQAAIIVDTGPGPSSGLDAWYFDSIHWGMAGKFTTSKTWNITCIEAWMQVEVGGPTNAIIYKDDADGTIPGSMLFFQGLTVDADPVAGWKGPSGLNWVLPAGTYWVGFEVHVPGIQGVVYYPAPNPLGAYAANILGTGWFSLSNAELGFRIQGNPLNPLGAIDLLLSD